MRKTAHFLLIFTVLILSPLLSFAETLQVSAVVPASADDFYVHLSSAPVEEVTLEEDEEIVFTIDYGSSLAYSTTLTIEGSWDKAEENSADVLSYVPGSASNAYNSTVPSIDTVNRKITWTIASYPDNIASQSVTFKLKTSSTLESTNPLTLKVHGKTLGPGTDATVTSTKSYYYQNAPTTQSSTGSSPTSTPTPTSPPAPTPQPIKPSLSSFEVVRLSETIADIRVITSPLTSGIVQYGLTPRSLSKSIKMLPNISEHVINLSDLEANTTYYLRFTLINKQGTTVSELFELKTAVKPEEILITHELTSLSSEQFQLTNIKDNDGISRFFTTARQPYELNITLTKSERVKEVDIVLNDPFSQKSYSNSLSLTEMIQLSKNVYTAKFYVPNIPSVYDLLLRIHDLSGGITEVKVGEVVNYAPFKIVKSSSRDNLAEANVELWYKDAQSNSYKRLNPKDFSLTDSLVSKLDGTLPLTLPIGSYKAKISRIGYRTQEVLFSIGQGNNSGYPTVLMEEVTISPLELMSYLTDSSLTISSDFLGELLPSLGSSRRMYHLTAALTLALFSLILLFSLSSRLGKNIFHLPSYLSYLFTQHKGAHSPFQGIIKGNEMNNDLSGALVYLKDLDGIVLAHSVTNKKGEFHFRSFPPHTTTLHIIKNGFDEAHFTLNSTDTREYILHKKTHKSIIHFALHLLATIFSSLLEVLLFLSFLLIILIGMNTSFVEILPFAALSFTSLLMWTLHYSRS